MDKQLFFFEIVNGQTATCLVWLYGYNFLFLESLYAIIRTAHICFGPQYSSHNGPVLGLHIVVKTLKKKQRVS